MKNRGAHFQTNWVGVCGTLPETLTLFQTKSVIFPILFQTWSPGAQRMTGARDKLLWPNTVGVNIKREMVLSPIGEEVALAVVAGAWK